MIQTHRSRITLPQPQREGDSSYAVKPRRLYSVRKNATKSAFSLSVMPMVKRSL